MKQAVILLNPRLLSFRNKGFAKDRSIRLIIFAAIGISFWAGIFAICYRVLMYFQSVEGLGNMLAYKLLSMILLIFFSLLIFSSILTSLSNLYMSKDLTLIHSLPVPSEKIFLAKWIESTIDSSWMVVVYTIPVFISYGIVFETGPFFYMAIVLTLFPLCIIASALSSIMVLVIVIILPASRIRSVFVFLGLALLVIIYITFRLLRPERLVNPENFASLLGYLNNLSTPSYPLLPSTWAFDSLKAALTGDVSCSLFNVALSMSCAAFLIFSGILIAKAIYFKGFSKSQASMTWLFQHKKERLDKLFSFLSGPTKSFVVKEIKTFLRDQAQWSQIFLIGALIVIYIYNFSVLPIEHSPIKTVYLQNLLSFLNVALAAFVLISVTARFAFPSISIEGSAFWIVRSAPIPIRTFLRIKFFIYLFPLLILSEILIIVTNLLLNVTPFMMYLSIITLFFLTPGVVSLGIGLGAAYPDFNSENPAHTVTGFGGLVFMIISAAYIGAVIVLEAGPVYTIFMSGIRNENLSYFQLLWIIGSFFTAFLISMLAIILPIRFGEKRLVAHSFAGL
ncbi:MAG: hypothetical protein HF982_11620 [Desulfobacteraceae bacterium]|nr:hypothetical protein [Desulfobacteraceae bacterium]MBC2720213.1 hypothetical protein [Desulfobacteraceae bacterium]